MTRDLARSILGRAAPAVKRRVTPGVWAALEQLRLELYLQRTHRASVKKAASFDTKSPLKLNLGCGVHPKKGWINIDLVDGSDLQLDLREPLPFSDNCVSFICAEHFFEHLAYPDVAFRLLRECHRVLMTGGRLDMAVPDAETAIREYAAGGGNRYLGDAVWWGPQSCNTLMHRLNYVFRQGDEHRYAYDFETLKQVLEAAGFTGVTRREHDPAMDQRSPLRSLIVVADKP